MKVPQTELVATRGGVELLRIRLAPGEYLIGREGEVNLLLPSEKVSRQHARLTLNYFDWHIEDLGSSNGTRVAGKKIQESTMIFPRQDLMVGDVCLQLRRFDLNEPADEIPAITALNEMLPRDVRGASKYRIHGILGIGGMGVVVEAEDRSTRRRIAMKLLLQPGNEEAMARFIQEAQVTAQLEHPNIIPIYELNVDELDRPYYTMKMVRGSSLEDVFNRLRNEEPEAIASFPLEERIRVVRRACEALSFAHSKGVVHRDIKPHNIMVGEFGEVLVMDWGLAKVLPHSAHDCEGSIRTLVRSPREAYTDWRGTEVGQSIGTPAYMSPEQASGLSHMADARTDVYSLCAILYTAITLCPPIKSTSIHDMLQRVANGKVIPLHECLASSPFTAKDSPIVPDLTRIVEKGMSMRPEDRFPSAKALLIALNNIDTRVRPRHSGSKPLFRLSN